MYQPTTIRPHEPLTYARTVKKPFKHVVAKVVSNLLDSGFDVVSDMDLAGALQHDLGLNFRNYKILCACIPQFAYRAISIESHLGLMIPCNIVIQEHENGEIEISAVNPMEGKGDPLNPSIDMITRETSARLAHVLRAV